MAKLCGDGRGRGGSLAWGSTWGSGVSRAALTERTGPGCGQATFFGGEGGVGCLCSSRCPPIPQHFQPHRLRPCTGINPCSSPPRSSSPSATGARSPRCPGPGTPMCRRPRGSRTPLWCAAAVSDQGCSGPPQMWQFVTRKPTNLPPFSASSASPFLLLESGQQDRGKEKHLSPSPSSLD